MNALRLTAVALIVAGSLALAYGSFSYTSDTHQARLGPVELSLEERKTINIPVWAGVAAVVFGGGLLLLGLKAKTA